MKKIDRRFGHQPSGPLDLRERKGSEETDRERERKIQLWETHEKR